MDHIDAMLSVALYNRNHSHCTSLTSLFTHDYYMSASLFLFLRGRDFRGDATLPSVVEGLVPGKRIFACALHKSTLIGYFPISMFGNAYT